jgi:flagellar biosynthetic protein FliP
MRRRLAPGLWIAVGLAAAAVLLATVPVAAAGKATGLPQVTINPGTSTSPDQSLEILALITFLAFLPAILLTMTAFTRVITVLSFLRSALGLQQTPPNQVLIGLALFLSFYVMMPTWNAVDHAAIVPYLNGHLSLTAAGSRAMGPLRTFMFSQTRSSDLALFLHLQHLKTPRTRAGVPTAVLIPAFIISELRTAFEIGVFIYIPFVIIDLVVATVLMSMGMIMVPPTLVSLPLKLLLFVLANGWTLVVQSLVLSFHH